MSLQSIAVIWRLGNPFAREMRLHVSRSLSLALIGKLILRTSPHRSTNITDGTPICWSIGALVSNARIYVRRHVAASQEETHGYANPVLPRLCDLAFLRFLSILRYRDAAPSWSLARTIRTENTLDAKTPLTNHFNRPTLRSAISSSSCRNDRLRYHLPLLATYT